MKMVIFILSAVSAFSMSQSSFSATTSDYLKIQSLKIRQLSGPIIGTDDSIPDLSPGFDIVGIGQELWSIISGNEPGINAGINNFSALPPGKTADVLEGWSDPVSADFQVEYANVLGMNVASFNYTVTFQYGGSLGGIGRYVAGATLIPSHISVDWGYKLDAEVQNLPPTNIGTDLNPIAMIQMALKWTVTSDFEVQQFGRTYTLDGTGRMIEH